MTFRNIAVVIAAAGALCACGGAELEPADGTGTPIPPQMPAGREDGEPRLERGVVNPGEVPDADHDGVPNAQDTSLVQP